MIAVAVTSTLADVQERMIVDRAYVQGAAGRNALVWDVRSADAYRKGHIPGAVNIGDTARVLRDDNTEDFVAIDQVETILSAAGIDRDAAIRSST
jgi:thiosulfate/3-mercaptopyruvate sulfurtransferase